MKPIEADKGQRGVSAGLSIRFGPDMLKRIHRVASQAENNNASELCRKLIEGALDIVESGAAMSDNLPTQLVRVRQRLSEPAQVAAPPLGDPATLAAMDKLIESRVAEAMARLSGSAPTKPPLVTQ